METYLLGRKMGIRTFLSRTHQDGQSD